MPKAPAKSKKAPLPNNADRPLSRTRYAHLLRDVQALVTTANEAVDQRKVQAQWQLGKRIAEERLSEQRGYHNSVIRDLATDMHTGARNLQYAVKFHRTYKTCPKHPLSWTHYRILLDRPTAASRAHYTKLALDEALTSPELARRIAADQRATTGADSALPRPTDPTYLYSATVVRVIDGDTLELSIDLGFEVNRSGTFRLADIDCPELPLPKRPRRPRLRLRPPAHRPNHRRQNPPHRHPRPLRHPPLLRPRKSHRRRLHPRRHLPQRRTPRRQPRRPGGVSGAPSDADCPIDCQTPRR